MFIIISNNVNLPTVEIGQEDVKQVGGVYVVLLEPLDIILDVER